MSLLSPSEFKDQEIAIRATQNISSREWVAHIHTCFGMPSIENTEKTIFNYSTSLVDGGEVIVSSLDIAISFKNR